MIFRSSIFRSSFHFIFIFHTIFLFEQNKTANWWNTHTHTDTLERNPGKTRKNAKLKNAGPTEITEASRQTAGAPTGGIRLQTSKRLPYQKIRSTLAPSHAHTFGASSHMPAAPLRSSTQHGTAYAASGTGPTPAIRGRGDAMAGADQSANHPELELSWEKTLPVARDRQKQLIYRGAATPKPDCVARRPTRKDENERKEFHRILKNMCDLHNKNYYPKYKKWCDEYFYLPHREEARGIGGIFFDYKKDNFEKNFKFVRDFGITFEVIF